MDVEGREAWRFTAFMATSGFRIRRFAATDLDRVCQIEQAVFSSPWSRGSFECEFGDGGTSFSWVAVAGRNVIGYIIAWLVEDELHIGNIAVDPERRGQGVGRALLTYCLARAAARGVSRATLEVRMSNETAIALYEKNGFVPVAIRKRYYTDNGEDAIVMLRAFEAGAPRR
jgi:[ribosomal protein S18]-alanine N-acetyltransferase